MTRDQRKQLEADLWRAADDLRANSDLAASEYATPVLGLIFLRFADLKYTQFEPKILAEFGSQHDRIADPLPVIAVRRCGFYLPAHARYDYLLRLPERENIAEAIKLAMDAIEEFKPELKGALPQNDYARFKGGDTLRRLLQNFANIPKDASGDLLGQIYEYFLGKFALSEGQGGGEFFTPRSVVRLMVEMIEPHGGKIFDPACGSGGMFVQSAHFIEAHRSLDGDAAGDFFCYGQEKNGRTVNLARMNLAVNGLRGQIMQGITYYDDHFGSVGAFDYVLANPPFNVNEVPVAEVEGDKRFNQYGIPRNKGGAKGQAKELVPNANYLWINLFATSLKPRGRAALVMANSASDARHSEAEIRQKLIAENLISAMVSLPSNLFYTVTLPATLWFFDRAKEDERVLFIDARNIFTPIDRAHREFSDEQIQNIVVISQLVKGRRETFVDLVESYFQTGVARLSAHQKNIEKVAALLGAALEEPGERAALQELVRAWDALPALEQGYENYRQREFGRGESALDEQNAAQRALRGHFDRFFETLHADLKRLDKATREHEKRVRDKAKAQGKRGPNDRALRELKGALEALHREIKETELPFSHIAWLQERFPKARYEDVTGLCKLATRAEIEEQEYSLNPGRYVGVVIEEDGKTEEEFIEEILALNEELEALNETARELAATISRNVKVLAGDL